MAWISRKSRMHALNLACLPRLLGFSFILVGFIVRAPNVRPLRDTCALKELRSDSINAVKFYRILRLLDLKFSSQNLICDRALVQIALKL